MNRIVWRSAARLRCVEASLLASGKPSVKALVLLSGGAGAGQR